MCVKWFHVFAWHRYSHTFSIVYPKESHLLGRSLWVLYNSMGRCMFLYRSKIVILEMKNGGQLSHLLQRVQVHPHLSTFSESIWFYGWKMIDKTLTEGLRAPPQHLSCAWLTPTSPSPPPLVWNLCVNLICYRMTYWETLTEGHREPPHDLPYVQIDKLCHNLLKWSPLSRLKGRTPSSRPCV